MIKNKKMRKIYLKKLILFLPILVLSCTANPPVIKAEKLNRIEKTEVNSFYLGKIKAKGEIKITINNLGFNSKALSDAIFPKKFADIKSFKIFLTTNFNDPFDSASIVTPVFWFNNDPANPTMIITNVPDGTNYYGVVSAYDDVANSVSANNITEPDNTILSIDKKWARTSNNVTMVFGNASYSDQSGSLAVSLPLKHGVPASADTSISILPGNPTTSGGEQIN